MKIYFLKYHLLFFVFFIGCSMHSNGQSVQDAYYNSKIEERKINTEKWQKTIEGIDYSEQKEEKEEEYDEDVPATNPSTPNNQRRRNYSGGGDSSAFFALFFKILFVIIVIVAVVLIVLHLTGGGAFVRPTNRKIVKSDAEITIDNIEEHIYESDLDRFIREAVDQSNYTLAIRLYYLAIIKELSLNRVIKWKKDKTNKDYLREMRKTNLFQPFREATRIFERIWYGEGELEKEDYQEIKPTFEKLVQAAQDRKIAIKKD